MANCEKDSAKPRDRFVGLPTSDYYTRKHRRRYPVGAAVVVFGPVIGLLIWGVIAVVGWLS